MSPRSPEPLSDGEIVSGDEEKAITTSARHARDSKVNTVARLPQSGSSSRAAQSSLRGFSGDRGHRLRSDGDASLSSRRTSKSPYQKGRGRSRSRSPFRVSKQMSGEKRRHEDDHYDHKGTSDPRRFKVRYEDNAAAHGLEQNRRRPQLDLDHPQQFKGKLSYDERPSDRGRHGKPGKDRGRGRDRSRSPFRWTKHGSRREQRYEGTEAVGTADLNGASEEKRKCNAFENEREPNPTILHGKNDAKFKMSIPQHNGPPKSGQPTSQEQSTSGESGPDHPNESSENLSEAELIEQRRKRREAIKARHKNNQPLLIQALQQNLQSAPATPVHDFSGQSSEQQSPPSSVNSPRTPRRDSPPESPAELVVTNDEELVDRRQVESSNGDDEGPSAADYENMDMQEDRPDHIHEVQRNDVDDANQPTRGGEQASSKQGKEFDMFADDDDDDMFAPADSALKPKTTTKQARALDQSLLDNWDYPDGHYRIILGELLDGRYAVEQQIGKGTFATVVRARDTRSGTPIAVKIACNNETMYKAGQKEMDMLNLLGQNDVEDKKHVIRLFRHFDHKGHLCLVFENLSADLREVLKKFGRNVGLNLKAIRSYAQQMFLALSHMKKCHILHADLKPDNILVSERRNLLKICDLGTATFANDAEVTPYLVSRFYRAPEVILGMPFDYAIDMWSIGCTLYELYTGRILFAGADNNQMLRAIQECRGKFPIRMLKRSTLVDKHFDADGNFYSQERDRITGKATAKYMNFNKTTQGKDLRARLSSNAKTMHPDEIKEHASFVDLMDKCLQLDPARRITPNEALRHAFVAHGGVSSQATGEKTKEPVKVAMNLPWMR